eukprot:CAMPEP_0171634276 /NCGR_PEP_ID=MMETSP0990-20121206/25818_1 /TAXON_ID=483369 /ORGANISM="non described non described, Strain CCMP2098" /LENGTH=83 /DNA_ID=CAMNT_0012205385 /DNA_START=306 /DNA_END=554 /DNA_ORIENTATION=+
MDETAAIETDNNGDTSSQSPFDEIGNADTETNISQESNEGGADAASAIAAVPGDARLATDEEVEVEAKIFACEQVNERESCFP